MSEEYQEDLHAELGYRTAGRRELAQREWFSLRGDADEDAPTPKAFKKLVNVLRVTKWQKENADRFRERQRSYYLSPERQAVLRARQPDRLAKQTKRRHDAYRTKAPVFTCEECGARWCQAPWAQARGIPPKFCTSACKERHRYHRNNPGARRRHA